MIGVLPLVILFVAAYVGVSSAKREEYTPGIAMIRGYMWAGAVAVVLCVIGLVLLGNTGQSAPWFISTILWAVLIPPILAWRLYRARPKSTPRS